jgi:hypothetical protein
MGTKISDRATGQIWTIMGDGEGHSLLMDKNQPKETPKSYRIKNEATGEERMIGYHFGARFELLS